MMFCWKARRQLADNSGNRRSRPLRLHLESCPSCRVEASSQEKIATLVSDAGLLSESSIARFESLPFEQRVMARLKERLEGTSKSPLRDPTGIPQTRVPLHWAAAAGVMIVVTVLAIFLGGSSSELPSGESATGFMADLRTPAQFHQTDSVIPAPEIPFVLRRDLAGARTGRMPVTTFVLEPAPQENSVTRASF